MCLRELPDNWLHTSLPFFQCHSGIHCGIKWHRVQNQTHFTLYYVLLWKSNEEEFHVENMLVNFIEATLLLWLMVTTNFAHDYFIFYLEMLNSFWCFRYRFLWNGEKGCILFVLTMESGIKIAHFGVVKYCMSLVFFLSMYCINSTNTKKNVLSSNYAIQWRNPIYSYKNESSNFHLQAHKNAIKWCVEFPRHSSAVG